MKRKSTLRKYYTKRPITRDYLKLVSETQRILKRLEKLGDKIMDLETDSVQLKLLAKQISAQIDDAIGTPLPGGEPLFEHETSAGASCNDRQEGPPDLPPPGKCSADNQWCSLTPGGPHCTDCIWWNEQYTLPGVTR